MKNNIVKISILLAILILGDYNSVVAQRFVTEKEAVLASINYMQKHKNQIETNDETFVERADVYVRNQDTILYEITFSDSTHLILSGVKICLPVLAVMKNIDNHQLAISDIASDNSGRGYFMRRYAQEIVDILDHHPEYKETHPAWQELMSKSTPSKNGINIPPLITSKWGQTESNDGGDDNAYNFYARWGCDVGCVSVAMGQIMNFWKYPAYRPDLSEQYDWCSMPDALFSHSDNYSYERHQVARLLDHCAQAAGVVYCVWFNGASFGTPQGARNAFVDKFHYHNAASVKYRNDFESYDEWKEMLLESLSMKRPIFYASLDSTGLFGLRESHAFVCDGYDGSNGKFHFNFGWWGAYDGWFVIDRICPVGTTYNRNERAIVNLYPRHENICEHVLHLETYYHDNITDDDIQNEPFLYVPNTYAYLVSAASNTTSDWRTIPSGASSEYVAHKEIILQDGFLAKSGCEFHAYIEKCERCENEDQSQLISPPGDQPDVQDDETMLSPADSTLWSVAQGSDDSGVRIHPNPTSGELTVEYTQQAGNWTRCELYDLQGRHLRTLINRSQPAGTYTENLSLAGLPSGTYLLLLRDQANSSAHRIVVR